MRARLLTIAITALAGSSALCAQTRTTTLEAVSTPGEVDKTTQTEDVKFRTDADERMTVPVHLQGSGPYRFLVDTGADRTAISRQLADRLQLKVGQRANLHSVAGPSLVMTATVPHLQLTRKAMKVTDAPLLERANMGADGIIGVDALRSQRVMFDFEAKTMSIVPAATPDFKAEPGTIVVEATRKNGRLVLTEARADGARLSVVLDTGAQVSIGNEALRQRLQGRNMLKGSQPVELESVTGQKITGDFMMIRELEIGGVSLRNLGVVFADAHTFRQLKLDRKPALLLGMNAMRAFKKVSIDFANKKLRVIVPEHSEVDGFRLVGREKVLRTGL